MNNHTPGPWKLTGWTATDFYGWTVECDQRFQLHAESAESEANAYLIAAAPDLLEALEAALDAECGKKCRCEQGWHAVAKAAVAKAKGTP